MKYLASVDIMALIESLPKDQRTDFLQSLACQDEVIAHVVDQMMTGYTENGSCAGEVIGAARWSLDARYGMPLSRAKAYVAMHAEAATQARLVGLADRLRLVEEVLTEERQKHWEKVRSLERVAADAAGLLREANERTAYWMAEHNAVKAELERGAKP